MSTIQAAEQRVLDYTCTLDNCADDQIADVIAQFTDEQFL